MRLVFMLLMLSLVTGRGALANEAASTKMKIEEAVENKKFQEDRRITDLELKAQAGSLSRYSLKFDLSYAGPPIDNLSDPEMPNPDNRPRNNRTSLGGFMGLRYRLNPNEALNLSAGFKWLSPYQQIAGDHVDKRVNEKDYEIANPQLSFDRTYALGRAQMRTSLSGTVTTADYYLNRAQGGSVGLSQGMKYVILNSRWTAGGVLSADYYFFSRDYEAKDGRISRYYLNAIPSLEYRILNNLNFRTSVAYGFSNMRLKGSWWSLDQPQPSARAGFGWAVTRDIYFNPFINFFTEKPSIRTSSLSFSTVFSIF